MAIQDIDTKCYILALFIRDDGERFLLGSGRYEFKDKQRHFAANTMQNDVVEVQGNDGFLLAGQVKRPGSQSFDGYVGDGTTSKQEVEEYRRDFFSFFRKNFFYQVIYIFPDGTAIQRKRGFLVDAPTVQELYQIYPEYHVALNFEDVNYYSYSENASGEEEFAKSATISLSASGSSGGLVWDDFGAVAEGFQWGEIVTATGTEITVQNDSEGALPITDAKMYGDTFQQTYSGKNLIDSRHPSELGQNVTWTPNDTGGGSVTVGSPTSRGVRWYLVLEAGKTYTISMTSTRTIGLYVADYPDDSYGSYKTMLVNNGSMNSSHTFVPTTNYVAVTFYVNANSSFSVDRMQLEVGDTATAFEPYVGGTASPNPDYPQEVQTVTGRQVVKVAGQNVFLAPSSANANFRSNFVKNSDNSFTLTATEGGINITAAYSRVDFTNLKKNTDYTVSWKKEVTSAATLNRAGYVAYDLGGGTVTTPADSPITFNTGDSTTARLYFYIGHGIASPGLTIGDTVKFSEVQLQTGTEATTFVPYQNAEYELNLGKNLFDKDNVNLRAGYFQASGVINGVNLTDLTSTTDRFFYIPCEPNTTYTITKPAQPTTKNNRFRVGTQSTLNVDIGATLDDFWWMNDGQQQNITTHTIKTGPNARYLFVFFAKATTATDPGGEIQELLDGIQIEEGSTATTYAPYFDPIELCKIGDYQDYIYRSGGEWYLHKEIGRILYNGSENWVANTNNNFVSVFYAPKPNTLKVGELNLISNNFADFATSAQSLDKYGIVVGGYLNIKNTDIPNRDVTAFKTWLATNNTIIYYPLATPTDTLITNQALIEDLNGLAGASFRTGESQLVVSASGNLVGELEISYYGSVDFEGSGFVWEEGGPSGPTTVEVDSIENVYPIWEVKGPATNPQLSVLTTNTTLRYNGTVAAGQTLTIDMMSKTAKLNGTSVIGNVSGEWVNFVPGNNRVVYTTNNANAESSTIYWQEVVG